MIASGWTRDRPICTFKESAIILGMKNTESFRHQVLTDKKPLHVDGRPHIIDKRAEELISQAVLERYRRQELN
jgi:hypothetical protein